MSVNSGSSSSAPRKKRTRPVSACENCHSRKVKCVLKPDEPVCERCSSSGKECLFRLDDLAPTLRLARFQDYDPPSKYARHAAASSDIERRGASLSSSSSTARASASSSALQYACDEGYVERPIETDQTGTKRKAKAVFRSFANPERLRAPSRMNKYDSATSGGQRDRDHPTTSRIGYQHPTHPSPGRSTHVGPESSHVSLDATAATRTDLHPHIQPATSSKELRDGIAMQQETFEPTSMLSLRSPASTPSPSAPLHYKKITLPFFRWFGATANTPGIRRIKVGIYQQTDSDGEGDDGDGKVAHQSETGEAIRGAGTDTLSLTPRPAPNEPGKVFEEHTYSDVESPASNSAANLFELKRPRYPRRDILLQLVKVTIKNFKSSCFPWLDEEELISGAESGQMPAILANAICAIAAPMSTHPDLGRGSGKKNADSFVDMAKMLIVPMLSWPSIDVIESLVIISYAEFAAGADSGLWMYIGMALRMATDLGLQHEAVIQKLSSSKQQDRARLLFWSIICLDRITCFGTGRSVTILEGSFDCKLPNLHQNGIMSNDLVFGYIVQTLLKRGRIGELLNQRTNDLMTPKERATRLWTLWHDLAHFYETLPPALQFGVTSFRKLANANQGAAFVYLHVLLQSTMSLLNSPSHLRHFDKDCNVSIPTKLASIASHASGTIVSILRFAEDAGADRKSTQDNQYEDLNMNPYIDCNPYLDQLILPAGRACLAEREGVRDALRRLGYAHSRPASRRGSNGAVDNCDSGGGNESHDVSNGGNYKAEGPFQGLIAKRQYAQMNLSTCLHMLDRLASRWSGAAWPAQALHQEAAGAPDDDMDFDSNVENVQPAPIRDVEMVLKWAKARGKRSGNGKGRRMTSSVPQGDGTAASSNEDSTTTLNQGLASPVASHLDVVEGSNASADSPLGLGFSGSFGTMAEIDIEALINAWTKQGKDVASSQQDQSIDYHVRSFDGGDVNDYASLDPSTSVLVPKPSSFAAHSNRPPQRNPYNHQFPSPINLDFSTMQLEEFFRSGFDQMQQPPSLTQEQSVTLAGAAANTQEWNADSTLYGLHDLPTALLNTFNLHYTT